jgi:HEPN domain-containing protein
VRVNKVIASYVRAADEDLRGARTLFNDTNRNAIFLCSQAAEKVIRAVLTSENKHGGTGHNLVIMVKMVPDENPIKPLLRAIDSLGDYATTYRYPTTGGRLKEPPASEEFERLSDCVDVALKDCGGSFQYSRRVHDRLPDAASRELGAVWSPKGLVKRNLERVQFRASGRRDSAGPALSSGNDR